MPLQQRRIFTYGMQNLNHYGQSRTKIALRRSCSYVHTRDVGRMEVIATLMARLAYGHLLSRYINDKSKY